MRRIQPFPESRIIQIGFWILFLICSDVYCQNGIVQALQLKVEELQESSSGDADFSDLAERIEELKDHPVNLNKADAADLRQFPFLTEKQIRALMTYKETYGEIYSVYELTAVEGFDSAVIQNILPFITILQEEKRKSIRLSDLFTRGHFRLLTRYQQVLQKQEGYSVPDSVLMLDPDAGYAGTQQKFFIRFKYDYFDRISLGIMGEKDPGEGFLTESQPYGMDFYAGYIALKNTGFLRNLIIGNFNADFGQGLTLCSGFSFGVLPSSGNLRRYARGITPSLSTNETSYLRGIAATITFKKLTGSIFYSRHQRDANIVSMDSLSGETAEISSFQGSGYHRLPDEIGEKNAVRETIMGGNLGFRNNYLSIGMTGFQSTWSATSFPGSEPYRKYSFSGKSNLNAGIDFQFVFRTIYGFGEISFSRNGGMAWLAGIQANPDQNIKLSVIYRNYQRNYQNLRSNAIGQNSMNTNEKGIILNLSARLSSKLGFYACFDLYKFAWLKYRTDFISSGRELSCQADYSPSKTVTMFLRYRTKHSQSNENAGTALRSWVNIQTESLRYQTNWQINAVLGLGSRFELIRFSEENKDPAYGYLICQDISLKPGKVPAGFHMRYALFNTGSYDVRIYTYESDVLYGYSVPALEGSGIRCYLMITSKPWKFLEIWIRYAHTYYADRKAIGTGLETIEGNNKSELKIQLSVKI